MTTHESPASIAQRLLWMIRHYRSDFGALSCPVVCRLTGPVDEDRLHDAVRAVVARHDSLRTTFRGRGAGLTQVVHESLDTPLHTVDGPATLGVELSTPVDPTVNPLRTTMWRTGPDERVLCLNLHHLVTDAWSTGVLFRDLLTAYDTGRPPPPPTWQYGDFLAAQQRILDDSTRHQAYWRRQLTGARLPRLPRTPGAAPGKVSLAVPAEPPRAYAKAHGATLFSVLLAAFHQHLRDVTGQRDLAVASMFANRSRRESHDTVGLLANMVLLRTAAPDDVDFADLVRRTHAAAVGAFAFQDLPFQLLPNGLVETTGTRADDVLFNVMTEVPTAVRAGDVRAELILPEDIGSRFAFELSVAPVSADELRVVLFHTRDTYAESEAADFLAGYAHVLGRTLNTTHA